MRFFNTHQQAAICNLILQHFSEMELTGINVGLFHINNEEVGGGEKKLVVWKLCDLLNRQNRMEELINYCVKTRPNTDWWGAWNQWEPIPQSPKSTELPANKDQQRLIGGLPSTMRFRDAEQRKTIRQMIIRSFSLDEMETMCVDLSISDEVAGNTKSSKAREITEYMDRHNRVEELIDYCVKERPKETWQEAWNLHVFEYLSKDSQQLLRTNIRMVLQDKFTSEELNTIMFNLGIDIDDFVDSGKTARIVELLLHCARHNLMDQLVSKICEVRPDVKRLIFPLRH